MVTKADLRNALGELENRLDDKTEGLGMRLGGYMSDCETRFDDLDIRVGRVEEKVARIK